MLLAFLEVFVSETLLILSVSCFIKVVHIELSHERGKVFVLKVFWKDFLGELVGPIHDKAIPLRIPKHILAVLRVLLHHVKLTKSSHQKY